MCAIHSRKAEIAISRPMMMSATSACNRFRCTSTSKAAHRVVQPEVEHPDDEWNRDDARPGQQGREVEEHAGIVAEVFNASRLRYSSRVRGLNLRSSSKRKVSLNFHGLGNRDTSPNGAARRIASIASWTVSLA